MPAQTTGAVPATSEVHIWVHVISLYGDPASELEPKDFRVRVGAGIVPVTVDRARYAEERVKGAIPTRVLIVLGAGEGELGQGDLGKVAARVRKLMDEGWQVSVMDAQGSQTPYVTTERELRDALRQRGRTTTVLKAAAELQRFVGRRVIFNVTSRDTRVERASLRAAREADAMLYHVNGDRWNGYTPAGPGPTVQATVPLSSLGGPTTQYYVPSGTSSDSLFQELSSSGEVLGTAYIPGPPEFRRYRSDGMVDERGDLRDACDDALRDGLGYYDLKVQVPDSAQSVALAVSVFAQRGVKYTVVARPYAEGRRPPEVVLVSTK